MIWEWDGRLTPEERSVMNAFNTMQRSRKVVKLSFDSLRWFTGLSDQELGESLNQLTKKGYLSRAWK